MKYLESNIFDKTLEYENSKVFQVFTDVHKDIRGGFIQRVSKETLYPTNRQKSSISTDWITQVNISYSKLNVFRGFHTQTGSFTQAKYVENCSVNGIIYDFIVDIRPRSKSFGISQVFTLYPLSSTDHNMLWIPKGFLHGFLAVGGADSDKYMTFQYFVDNHYNKESEICVNPIVLLEKTINNIEVINLQEFEMMIKTYRNNEIIISDKDKNGIDYDQFLNLCLDEKIVFEL